MGVSYTVRRQRSSLFRHTSFNILKVEPIRNQRAHIYRWLYDIIFAPIKSISIDPDGRLFSGVRQSRQKVSDQCIKALALTLSLPHVWNPRPLLIHALACCLCCWFDACSKLSGNASQHTNSIHGKPCIFTPSLCWWGADTTFPALALTSMCSRRTCPALACIQTVVCAWWGTLQPHSMALNHMFRIVWNIINPCVTPNQISVWFSPSYVLPTYWYIIHFPVCSFHLKGAYCRYKSFPALTHSGLFGWYSRWSLGNLKPWVCL